MFLDLPDYNGKLFNGVSIRSMSTAMETVLLARTAEVRKEKPGKYCLLALYEGMRDVIYK